VEKGDIRDGDASCKIIIAKSKASGVRKGKSAPLNGGSKVKDLNIESKSKLVVALTWQSSTTSRPDLLELKCRKVKKSQHIPLFCAFVHGP
jgi:hypothetical protein